MLSIAGVLLHDATAGLLLHDATAVVLGGHHASVLPHSCDTYHASTCRTHQASTPSLLHVPTPPPPFLLHSRLHHNTCLGLYHCLQVLLTSRVIPLSLTLRPPLSIYPPTTTTTTLITTTTPTVYTPATPNTATSVAIRLIGTYTTRSKNKYYPIRC